MYKYRVEKGITDRCTMLLIYDYNLDQAVFYTWLSDSIFFPNFMIFLALLDFNVHSYKTVTESNIAVLIAVFSFVCVLIKTHSFKTI